MANADPFTSQLSQIDTQGTGVMDVVIRGSLEFLKEEYKAQRIIQKDYAAIVAQLLTKSMDTASTYVLQKALADAQVESEKKKSENLAEEAALLRAKTAATLADKDLTLARIPAAQKETQLMDKKLQQADAEIALSQKELDIKEQQRLVMIQQVAESIEKVKLMAEQVNRMTEEVELLKQRVITERGQTDGTAFNATSILGRQSALYEEQKNGYVKDAKVKGAKPVLDLAGTTIAATGLKNNAFTDAELTAALAALATVRA